MSKNIQEEEKTNKFYMKIFLGAMVLVSLVVAIIMTNNYSKDTSKERFQLTKEYKKIKKEDYSYNSQRGMKLYNQLCAKCHKHDGSGTMQNPPLAGSKIINNEPTKALKIIVKGMSGKIERQGRVYNSIMPSFKIIPHEDIAHVLNFIRNSFGNKATNDIHHVEVVKAKIDTLNIKGTLKESDL